MTNDARRIEMTTLGASAAGRLGSTSRGEFEMLAPLAIDLLIMLITCALILLICWACDTDRAEIEAGQSHPDLETVTENASAYRVGWVARSEAHEFLNHRRSGGPRHARPTRRNRPRNHGFR